MLEQRAAGLAGKVTVVTDGVQGSAICWRLAADGARVAVLDVQLPAAQDTVRGDGLAAEADVSDSAAVDATFDRIVQELGRLDFLVNNAWRQARRTSLASRPRGQAAGRGRDRPGRHAARRPCPASPTGSAATLREPRGRHVLLQPAGRPPHGAARLRRHHQHGVYLRDRGLAGHPHYSAAKAAILGLTRSAAKELIVQGIRVNALAPGFVDTSAPADKDAARDAMDANRCGLAATVPAGRMATPEEVASAAAFLASDESAYFAGATLSPDGGLVTAA